MGSTSATASPGAVRPVTMPFVDRLASALVSGVPPVMVGIGMYFGWMGNLLNWQDLLILSVCYFGIGTGVTVGFHRLLTHQSFKCHGFTRATLAAVGSMAAEGPVIDWWPPTASTTSSPTSRATLTVRTSATALGGVGHSAGWLTPTSAGCSATWRSPTSAATPKICSPTHGSASSIAPSCCGSSPGSPLPSASASR